MTFLRSMQLVWSPLTRAPLEVVHLADHQVALPPLLYPET